MLETVEFKVGQTEAPVQIDIVDDKISDEGNETFYLTLKDPSGADIREPETLKIIITDKEGDSLY